MAGKPIIRIGTILVASCEASLFMMGNIRILFPDTPFLLHQTYCNKRIKNICQEELKEQQEKTTEILWSYVVNNSEITKEELWAKTRAIGD